MRRTLLYLLFFVTIQPAVATLLGVGGYSRRLFAVKPIESCVKRRRRAHAPRLFLRAAFHQRNEPVQLGRRNHHPVSLEAPPKF